MSRDAMLSTPAGPFASWADLAAASHPVSAQGSNADVLFDRQHSPGLVPSHEALFTQSNARVLLGQAAGGALRFVSLPTQVYPGPTGLSELGFAPGIYHRFDVAMYVGDLSYRIELEGGEAYDFADTSREVSTTYADQVFPRTLTKCGVLDAMVVALAPVAADARTAPLAPAPLPGPAGALYVLVLRNTGKQTVRGTVVLNAGDRLIGQYPGDLPLAGQYSEAERPVAELMRPRVAVRQQTLVLVGFDGAAGIHLRGGHWTRFEAPFRAERGFTLEPGGEVVIETQVALGREFRDILPTIFEFHLRSALEWLNRTAAFWRSRFGSLELDAPDARAEVSFSRECYIRCLLDNFNCLQTDADGNVLAHWQGAPSHGYGLVWGIDVEPTAVSVAQVVPELAWSTMRFFLQRSRAPRGPADHSVPILVAPVILARRCLQVTGDLAPLRDQPDVLAGLESILNDLAALRAPNEALYPSRYSSDGAVGRRYDYGTNVKVWYTFSCMAYLLRHLGRTEEADRHAHEADAIRAAIERTMVAEGPLGRQYSGGTNLDSAPDGFYLPERIHYYDGEDTSSMLAPVYGLSSLDHEPWINYHRFARSLWCPNFDPEFGVLRWSPREFSEGALDGTGFFSRLGGSVARNEMREALALVRDGGTDPVTGSVYWWPHGLEYRRALTRCSQGQGAWAWQYLAQWLGLEVDALDGTLTLAPRGLPTTIVWHGFRAGSHRFDIEWREGVDGVRARIVNHTPRSWTVRVGIRQAGSGATDRLEWRTQELAVGGEAKFVEPARASGAIACLDEAALVRREVEAFGSNGILIRRFGPGRLFGHWDSTRNWFDREVPLSLRLVVANGTVHDWTDVLLELTCPARWRAQARPAQHWPMPDAMVPGVVCARLKNLPSGSRTVAPFWIAGPRQESLHTWVTPQPNGTFHSVSQPGPELNLRTSEEEVVGEFLFRAELKATAADGRRVQEKLEIPVRVTL